VPELWTLDGVIAMKKSATIFVELNCYEKGLPPGDGAATVWFIPRQVETYSDFDSLKKEATHIVGPISYGIANGVASSFLEALRQMNIEVEELTVADD
jgi:hypothetical protein